MLSRQPIMELWMEDLYHELGDRAVAWLIMENDHPNSRALVFTWLAFGLTKAA